MMIIAFWNLLDLIDYSLEGLGMVHCQVSQYFPVQLNIVLSKFVHETRVGDIMLAGSSVDAGNPKATESPFFSFPVAIRILHPLFEGIFGNCIDFAAGAKITAGCFKNFFASFPRRYGIY